MLIKNSKVIKSIIYVFEKRKLAISIPIKEELIMEKIDVEILIDKLSKPISKEFDYIALRDIEEKIEKIRELFREEEDYSFSYIISVIKEDKTVDVEAIKFIQGKTLQYKKLIKEGFEIVNIDCLFYNIEKYKGKTKKRKEKYNLLDIKIKEYNLSQLLESVNEKSFKNDIDNSIELMETKDIIDKVKKENLEIFIALSLDIFNELLVAKSLIIGKYEKILGECNYNNFNNFGIHLEFKEEDLIISVGDFNGEQVHLEELEEVIDLKYLLMSYVDRYIKVA